MEQISVIHGAIVGVVILLVVLLISSQKIKRLRDELRKERTKVSSATSLIEEYEEKYAKVIDLDAECEKIRSELVLEKSEIEARSKQELEKLEAQKAQLSKDQLNIEDQIKNLRMDYKNKKNTYDALSKQIAIFSEDVELIELGFYEPKFDFDVSERFKEAIKSCKERQKSLLREHSSSGAIYCYRDWTVDGSRTEGKKMTNKGIRLTARAFNNECEAAIANCTWKNVVKMEERIRKAFSAINQLNESNAISITERYLDEKLKELQLTYEYHEKRQREKEEQAEIKAQMREEAKIEAEIKKAEADAIKEEKRYQKALETARQELTEASDEAKAALESQIAELQASLEEAERKHQRAQSMAEQTKQGHVYIISNIGSFGEEVYKIGMTRRLEPMDRVKELGDASVPFTFDVHAMIHTTDAPTLEKNLHDKFDSRRLNMVNRRKEFFNVSLDEIKQAVQGFTDHDVEFIETAVAQDYYETKAMKKQQLLKEGQLLENEISVSSKLLEFADEL